MLDTPQPERRRAPRQRRRLLVHDLTGSSRSARPSIDLWQDGVRLVVEREHRAGALLELDLYLGDRTEPLRMRGEIMTVRGGQASIRFLGPEGARARLAAVLSAG